MSPIDSRDFLSLFPQPSPPRPAPAVTVLGVGEDLMLPSLNDNPLNRYQLDDSGPENTDWVKLI